MDFLRIFAVFVLTTALALILIFAVVSMIAVLQGSAP